MTRLDYNCPRSQSSIVVAKERRQGRCILLVTSPWQLVLWCPWWGGVTEYALELDDILAWSWIVKFGAVITRKLRGKHLPDGRPDCLYQDGGSGW